MRPAASTTGTYCHRRVCQLVNSTPYSLSYLALVLFFRNFVFILSTSSAFATTVQANTTHVSLSPHTLVQHCNLKSVPIALLLSHCFL